MTMNGIEAAMSKDWENTMRSFETMTQFLGLDADDGARLAAFLPRVEDRLPAITDSFYELLLQQETLATLLENRIDGLKRTHVQWMRGLFNGEYGQRFFEEQMRVGSVHVRVGLDSMWVDAVMNFLRRELHGAVVEAAGSTHEANAVYGSLLKVMDLALMTINLAYNEHRMQLLHDATGMPRALLERLIRVSVDA